MTKVESVDICTECAGVACLRTSDGVYMKKDNRKTPQIIIGKIEGCPKRIGLDEEEDVDKWFELYGKTDTMNLGC